MTSEMVAVTRRTNFCRELFWFGYTDVRPSLFQDIVSTNEDVIIVLLRGLEGNSGLALAMTLKVYDNIQNK